MKLIFDVSDKPKAGQLVVFALQQMLAILAATIAVPLIIGKGLTPAAAMFGAGVGTIVYILFTKRKSPVFLGSSFAFLGSMAIAQRWLVIICPFPPRYASLLASYPASGIKFSS